MSSKHNQFDSSEIIQLADNLMEASSNRYRMAVQVANRAKRYRYEDFDNVDDPMMKPVIRAIIEISDELTQPEIIDETIKTSLNIKSLKSKQNPVKSSSLSSSPPSSPSSPPSSPSSSSPPSPLQASEQIIQINTEVNTNYQLRQLKQESNLDAWNNLVNWIAESVCNINFPASEASVKRLQDSHQEKSQREIARILIVQKSLQAAGVDLLRGIPMAETVIEGIAKYDLPEVTKMSAEIVYQIANIYGFDLQDPDRKVEALTAFGVAFLGEKAIEAGIDWLEYGIIPSKMISAGSKAIMIYAIGNAACMFYEAKLNLQINPLTSPKILNEIRQGSQHYLDGNTSEEAIVNLISTEINIALTIDYTRLTNLLKARDWKKADKETRNIIVKIANRDFQGNLKILPSDDLRTINQLWSENSNGHFGFKAQKQVYLNVSRKVGDFGEKIGWRREAGIFGGVFAWKSYESLIFNLNNAPKGHLPAFPLDMPWWYHKGEETRDFVESILERDDW